LARGWMLGLQLVQLGWVWAMGVGRWLVAGVAGSMEVADAVVSLDTGGRCRGCQDH
jgi:hypothetical protein